MLAQSHYYVHYCTALVTSSHSVPGSILRSRSRRRRRAEMRGADEPRREQQHHSHAQPAYPALGLAPRMHDGACEDETRAQHHRTERLPPPNGNKTKQNKTHQNKRAVITPTQQAGCRRGVRAWRRPRWGARRTTKRGTRRMAAMAAEETLIMAITVSTSTTSTLACHRERSFAHRSHVRKNDSSSAGDSAELQRPDRRRNEGRERMWRSVSTRRHSRTQRKTAFPPVCRLL